MARVRNVMNPGRSGLYDWMIQRVSAVILGAYFVVILGFIISHDDLQYVAWVDFILSTPMRIFTVLALLAMVGHAWVGLWIISTDYIKPVCIRIPFQVAVVTVVFVYLIWGLQVLWGV